MIRYVLLWTILTGVTAQASPLPVLTRYNAVTINRASRQLTVFRALSRPDGQPMTVRLTLVTPGISFAVNSASAYNNGVFLQNQNTLSVSNNVGMGTYSLTVRANSASLTSGVNTIPVSQIDMQLVNINGAPYNGPLVTLSTANQSLAVYPYSGASFTGSNLYFNYRLKPGAGLLRPAGTYSTSITFTITGP